MQFPIYMDTGISMPDYVAPARLFHLLSSESRLRIVDELRYRDACVCHLQHHLGRPQAYVSQQLRILRDGGLVEGHKEGVNVFYALTQPVVRELLDAALGPIDEDRPVDPACPCPHCASAACDP
jgi:ArsR family transcriptional regulator